MTFQIKINNIPEEKLLKIVQEWRSIVRSNPSISPQEAALKMSAILNKYGMSVTDINF